MALIQENLNKLENISKLEENWNGYNCKSIPKEVCDFSANIIRKLGDFQPKIFPTGRESVQFEYEKNEEYLEFEIFSSKEIEMFRITRDKKEIEKHVTVIELIEMARKFFLVI